MSETREWYNDDYSYAFVTVVTLFGLVVEKCLSCWFFCLFFCFIAQCEMSETSAQRILTVKKRLSRPNQILPNTCRISEGNAEETLESW